MFNSLKFNLILLGWSLFASFSYSQSTCSTPLNLNSSNGNDCVLQNVNFEVEQAATWFSYYMGSTSGEIELQTQISDTTTVELTTAVIYSGNCGSLVPIDTQYLSSTSTVSFEGLEFGFIYSIELTRADATKRGKIKVCAKALVSPVGHLVIYDSDGNPIYWCEADVDYSPIAKLGWYCDPVYVCVGETLTIELTVTDDGSTIDNDFFIQQTTTLDVTVVENGFNGTSTEASLTFNEVGNSSFFIHAWYTEPNPDYDVSDFPDWVIDFIVLPVGSAPPATIIPTDDDYCLGEDIILDVDSPPYKITNIYLNGTLLTAGPVSSISIPLVTLGNNTITYTTSSRCGESEHTYNFVVSETNLTSSITSCGLATFNFHSCGGYDGPITMTYGDGTEDVVFLTGGEGDVTFTHQYPIGGSYNWDFEAQVDIGSTEPPFVQSGTTGPFTIQPLTISGPNHLCEFIGDYSVPDPSGTLQNIVWSTSPVYAFSGQGTASITPTLSWTTSTTDITVSVTATDINGCLYEGTYLVETCCAFVPPVNGTEYFEQTYYTHSSTNPSFYYYGLSSQLPLGVAYNARNNVAISLSTPPSLSTAINTSYSTSTTLSQFIADNGIVVSSGTISIPNTWVFLNNDLIIDMNITIINSPFIRIAEGASIILNPSTNLVANNSTFAPKCNAMWGGFKALNVSNTISMVDVNIVGAINGIENANSANMNIRSCIFVDNYIGINKHDDATAASETVVNSYFGDVPDRNLLAPYATQIFPEAGILLDLVNNILIGNAGMGSTPEAARGNLFRAVKRGIDAKSSTVYAYKNAFYQIGFFLNSNDNFAGIRAIGRPLESDKLWVGNATYNRNLFVTCDYGISARDRIHIDARYNYMRGVRLRGISWETNPTRTMDVFNNDINSINSRAFGIYAKNYANGTANIRDNKINTNIGITTASTTRFGTGIYASSVAPTTVQTTLISNNDVRNSIYGIWMINTLNGKIEFNKVQYDYGNATINSLADHRGILVEKSDGALVYDNRVNGSLLEMTLVANSKLQGLRVEMCAINQIFRNTFTKTPVGYYVKGNNIASKVECNHFNYNRNGLLLESADISNQGLPVGSSGFANGYSAHNDWLTDFNLSARSDGTTMGHSSANPLKYYHQNVGIYNSNPTVLLDEPGFWNDIPLITSIGQTPRNSCPASNLAPIVTGTPELERQKQLETTVNGLVIYDSLDAQMKHYMNLSGLNKLLTNPSLLSINPATDAIYQDYVASMLSSVTKTLLDIDKYIGDFDNGLATSLINSLDGSNVMLNANKTVQTIWNNSMISGIIISPSDSTILHSIACSDPLIYGTGVYQARAILDWTGECGSYGYRNSNVNHGITEDIVRNVQIYPNPSNGKFEIKTNAIISNVVIIDIKGMIVYQQLINFDTIDCSNLLTSGIYIVQIQLQDGTLEKHKIVIE